MQLVVIRSISSFPTPFQIINFIILKIRALNVTNRKPEFDITVGEVMEDASTRESQQEDLV